MFMRKVIHFSTFILGITCPCGNKSASVHSTDSSAVDSIEVVNNLTLNSLNI
jgi:hypothetical protein